MNANNCIAKKMLEEAQNAYNLGLTWREYKYLKRLFSSHNIKIMREGVCVVKPETP